MFEVISICWFCWFDLLCLWLIDDEPVCDWSSQVSQESISNKMSASNLSCVFGVNLLWPRHGSISLTALTPINIFTELLIEHFLTVFASRRPAGEVEP